jgi:hypothetical protein
MRRRGNLWPQLITFANLDRAAMKARRSKRQRPDVLRFHFNLERELWRLHDELSRRDYRPGRESGVGAFFLNLTWPNEIVNRARRVW